MNRFVRIDFVWNVNVSAWNSSNERFAGKPALWVPK